jgi:hypothetical protein
VDAVPVDTLRASAAAVLRFVDHSVLVCVVLLRTLYKTARSAAPASGNTHAGFAATFGVSVLFLDAALSGVHP